LPEPPADDDVWVNDALARRLELQPGVEIVLRVPRASALPPDVPLAADSTAFVSRRLRVAAIVSDGAFGRFDLRLGTIVPYNVFLSRDALAALAGRPGAANTLLIATALDGVPDAGRVRRAIAEEAVLADHELEIRTLPDGRLELWTPRVFLDPAAVAAARAAAPNALVTLTYLVNSIAIGNRDVLYSFVAGLEEPPAPGAGDPDGLVVHEWTAKHLGGAAGDAVRLTYSALDATGRLIETSAVVRLRAVVPFDGSARDATLMPAIPGIAEAASCSEWEASLPLDFSRIRPEDEDYWNRWRGAPKAFVPLALAQALWSNRFGTATAVRWPARTDAEALRRELRVALSRCPPPWRVAAVRQEGLKAAGEGTDLGALFLGLGMFVLASAALLTILVFGLGLQARAGELALQTALGFTRARVRRLLLTEEAAVAATAAAPGTALGCAGAVALVVALRTVWRGAVGGVPLDVTVGAAPLLIGAIAGFLLAAGTIWGVLRRRLGEAVRQPRRAAGPSGLAAPIGAAAGCVAALLMAAASRSAGSPAGLGLAAGGVALLAGGLGWAAALAQIERRTVRAPHPAPFGVQNWGRNARQTLAAILMPAFGWFVVFAVDAHRPRIPDVVRRDGPADGFALFGESAVPLAHDPADPAGRERLGLDGLDARLLALRRHEGADASCLNLNRVQRPPLLGVPSRLFEETDAFAWARRPVGHGRPWSALRCAPAPDVVPAVLDASVATWGLRWKVGDRVPMTAEDGRPLELEVVGLLADSIFQGHVLLDEAALLRWFPSAGRRVLLVEASPEQVVAVRQRLERVLSDTGLELETTVERLDRFLEVQRTYLDIFLWFGALGLTLGAAGFGVIARRNLIERRPELAMLRVLGWDRRRLWFGLAAEHAGLALVGLLTGALAAAIAFPGAAASLRPGPAGVAALGLLLGGWLGVNLSARSILRGPLLDALRQE